MEFLIYYQLRIRMSTEGVNGPIEGVPSEFDYFENTAFQTAIVSEYDQQINPTGSVHDGGPIEFVITGANLIYLNLNNSKLQVKAKITLANGNNLAAGECCGSCFIPCFQKWI